MNAKRRMAWSILPSGLAFLTVCLWSSRETAPEQRAARPAPVRAHSLENEPPALPILAARPAPVIARPVSLPDLAAKLREGRAEEVQGDLAFTPEQLEELARLVESTR